MSSNQCIKSHLVREQHPPTHTHLPIIKRIPTQRTTTRITALKPLKQTTPMKQILARSAPLARELTIAAYDTVADGALTLAL